MLSSIHSQGGLLDLAINLAYIGFIVSFVMSFIRLALGPTLADRIVALDLIAFVTIGFIVVYTMDSRQVAFLDIAITLALVAFLSTIVLARFIMASDKEE